MISVSLITYNHAEYISDCLDGILSQKVNDQFEVIVGDDFSTDGTSRIVDAFAERFPAKIRVRRPAKNMGILSNWTGNLSSCKGDFVALCDGDDLWVRDDKLQLQLDVLRSDAELSSCYHSVKFEDRFGNDLGFLPRPGAVPVRASIDFMASRGSFMPTSSILFRSPGSIRFPEWYSEMRSLLDYPLNLLIASRGDAYFLQEVLGVYRTNSTDHACSGRPFYKYGREEILMLELLDRHFAGRFHNSFDRRIQSLTVRLANDLARNGDFAGARSVISQGRARGYLSRHHEWEARLTDSFRALGLRRLSERNQARLDVALSTLERRHHE
jgi:glycosyltransferase involved in cell wall biosynthesis